MGGRRWSQWPSRTVRELNGVSGVAGVGGVAVGAGGLTFLVGGVALAFAGVGAIMVTGAIGYAIYKAVPPPTRKPEELVGRKIDLDELTDVAPAIRRLSIVGISQAGKTTLRTRLAVDPSSHGRTQRMTAQVISLQTAPASYIAILDGGGERYPQQFKITEMCDYLCIVVDHNVSDSDTSINTARLAEHRAFLAQVRHHLDQVGRGPIPIVHFLLNKHDLWISAPAKKQHELLRFCADELQKWRDRKNAGDATYKAHSNEKPDDVAAFMSLLKQMATA
jgi:hypothetical protein